MQTPPVSPPSTPARMDALNDADVDLDASGERRAAVIGRPFCSGAAAEVSVQSHPSATAQSPPRQGRCRHAALLQLDLGVRQGGLLIGRREADLAWGGAGRNARQLVDVLLADLEGV